MPRLLLFVLLTLLITCTNQVNQNTIVLNYSDFGPQVIASEIIGMEWWQWQSHGESRPTVNNIKIIVFREIPLNEVKELYAVNQYLQKDYRYLKYEKAINFLDSKIDANVMENVTNRLKQTRLKLINTFSK